MAENRTHGAAGCGIDVGEPRSGVPGSDRIRAGHPRNRRATEGSVKTSRRLTRLALTLALVTLPGIHRPTAAQTKVLVIGGAPVNDVTRLGLTIDNNTTQARAEANLATLQAFIDTNPECTRFPLYFRSVGVTAHAGTRVYAFSDTVNLPYNVGSLSWIGQGNGTSQGTGNVYQPRLCLPSDENYAATSFDGTTRKLTSTGAGAVAVVHGREVTANDVCNSVYISGGTNATTGWRGIVAVTPGPSGTGTWTFGDDWCTGAVTDGVGKYCPALLRDKGKGNVFQGLAFTAQQGNSDEEVGCVGFHVIPNLGPDSPINTANSGKQLIQSCFFRGFRVAVLQGKNLDAWQAGEDFDGRIANHADHMTTMVCHFHDCESCFVKRNQQSLGDFHFNVHTVDCGTVFDVESGGKVFAYGVHLQGNGNPFGHTQLFRIGPRVSGNESMFACYGFSIDGSTLNPQLIVTDRSSSSSPLTVVVSGGVINRGDESTLPLVDIQGKTRLKLSDIGISSVDKGGFMAGDLLLRDGSSGSKTHTTFDNVRVLVQDLTELFDENGPVQCDDGHSVTFRSVTLADGTISPDRRYVTGTGWVPLVEMDDHD